MTNASVKPALTRIEGKLDEIDQAVKKLNNSEKTQPFDLFPLARGFVVCFLTSAAY